MTYKSKRRFRIIRDYIFGWLVATNFLLIVRGVGTIEEGYVNMPFWEGVVYSFIMGPVFGLISGVLQIITIERLYKRVSLTRLILGRFLLSLLFVALLVLFSYVYVGRYVLGLDVGILEFAFDAGSFAIYFYLIFIDIFLTVLGLVNQVLGDGNLRRLLFGRFYTPRDEERIFMFVDLQSSTEIAERLGHIRYSYLIQDCFDDLSVVAEHDAEIYQYVGDGVILTWKLDRGLKAANCLHAFFLFQARLHSREKYYLKRYGEMPIFKAGMNAGLVTVTEVGRYKREIAYHGDTINTAARVQDKCNELGEDFLITENLVEKLQHDVFDFQLMGEVALKGKAKDVKVYGVAMG